MISWVAFILSLIGAILMVLKSRTSWYYFLGANVFWIVYALNPLQMPLILESLMFMVVNFYGLKYWKK